MEKCRVFSFTNKENSNKAYVILHYMDDHHVQVKGKSIQILFNAIGKPDNKNNVSFVEEANGKLFEREDDSIEFILKQRQLDYENGIDSYNLGNMFINTVDNTVFFEEM